MGDTLVIKCNKILTNEANEFSIKMDSVLEDSRGPINANCNWVGNASARFMLTISGISQTIKLHTYLKPKDTIIGIWHIRMISLSPYPNTESVIKQSDYVASVMITQLGED